MADEPTPCTPHSCVYGPGHACMTVFPDQFPEGSSTVWTKRRAQARYGIPYGR